jgi:hypothetical protein
MLRKVYIPVRAVRLRFTRALRSSTLAAGGPHFSMVSNPCRTYRYHIRLICNQLYPVLSIDTKTEAFSLPELRLLVQLVEVI